MNPVGSSAPKTVTNYFVGERVDGDGPQFLGAAPTP